MLGYSPSINVQPLSEARELLFMNPNALPCIKALPALPFGMEAILDAEARLMRFAPFIERVFPETRPRGGIIESDLIETPSLLKAVAGSTEARLFVKMDAELPIAGSVKARGGIYEVLKYTELLAQKHGILSASEPERGYAALDTHRRLFSEYSIHAGSTGNLGLSIGITSAAIGYRVFIHMSADAKTWKKELLRKNGVTVIEYNEDYSEAVRSGRESCALDPASYFIDDENSLELFMGYATAALRLKRQLDERNIIVDNSHPLLIYLPCGVGGAPGGITFGLKQVFGDAVYCFFIEPVNAPCMLAAFLYDECVPVSSLGLSGRTDADGLAVGKASKTAYKAVKHLMTGEFTVADERLIPALRLIYDTEGLFVEPSAAAALCGIEGAFSSNVQRCMHNAGIALRNATHILWATGGGLVPETEKMRLLGK